MLKTRFVLSAFIASVILVTGAMTRALADDPVPQIILHVNNHPLPDALDLRGTAIAPDSQLQPCARDDRKQLQPDLDAVSALVKRAGGMRLRKRDFKPGAPITTPDGLILSLVATANGSYVVAIDSTHTQNSPERYFDPCLKLASGSVEKITRLGLTLPHLNFGTAQYSPAVGFYLFLNSK